MPFEIHTVLKLGIWLAGGVHLLIALANFFLPAMFDYRGNLARMTPFIRQIFLAHAAYIVLVLAGFAGLCLFFADDLAGGSALGQCLSGFLGVFWLSRIGVQMLFYDREIKRARPWANFIFTSAFLYLGTIFAAACIFGKP